ncbi:hypothetical protein [Reichenbachiella sp.]|uniref:hypothetical protein n=1 Tax=Reichenbachiella sp. TaxID=2184521 RepID=UPI003B5C5170
MITFIFFQPADDWKMLAMIIFLFSLLPAIVLNHFITYWKHIAIDSVVNDYSEKSIEIKFKTGEQIVLTKSNTKIVINHAIKRAWKRLFWGGFEYNVITP